MPIPVLVSCVTSVACNRPGHSARGAVGRLQLGTHTSLTHQIWSGLTMLSRYGVGIPQGNEFTQTRNSSGRACPHLSQLTEPHGLTLDLNECSWWTWADLNLKMKMQARNDLETFACEEEPHTLDKFYWALTVHKAFVSLCFISKPLCCLKAVGCALSVTFIFYQVLTLHGGFMHGQGVQTAHLDCIWDEWRVSDIAGTLI